MIVRVTEENIQEAGRIHSISWKESHKVFCLKEFVEKHDVMHQTQYVRNEIKQGKEVYLLLKDKPVGIVSIWNSLIENLYILPEEQGKGYGTELLLFVMKQCKEEPTLWILDNNKPAYLLYTNNGFEVTGEKHVLSETISEIELRKRLT